MPLCVTGARVRLTERCCLTSTSSKSLTVVPSSTRPGRWIVPVATSRVSTRVVFPAPEWPTSTTFRTVSGWPAVGALPAAPDVPVFSAIRSPPVSFVRLLHDQPLPAGSGSQAPPPESPARLFAELAPRQEVKGGRPPLGKHCSRSLLRGSGSRSPAGRHPPPHPLHRRLPSSLVPRSSVQAAPRLSGSLIG